MVAIMIPAGKNENHDLIDKDMVVSEIQKAFNWESDDPSYWVNAEMIAEITALPKTRQVFTIIGREIRKFPGVKTKRTGTARLILVPQAKI